MLQDLMGLISMLQKEMAKEQENFNGLSSALQGLKDRNSRQYKTISRDMMASQGRLTTLMNRSMKCFSMVSFHGNDIVCFKKKDFFFSLLLLQVSFGFVATDQCCCSF